jgi:hypothetical protein
MVGTRGRRVMLKWARPRRCDAFARGVYAPIPSGPPDPDKSLPQTKSPWEGFRFEGTARADERSSPGRCRGCHERHEMGFLGIRTGY